jgi:uncharacterized protein
MDTLIDFFDSDDLSDDVMYYPEMHGFLTSLAIQPSTADETKVLVEILPDTQVNASIKKAIKALQNNIKQSLLNNEFPDIPETGIEDEDVLILWSSGFMQGIFFQEDAWFSTHPEDVAELTLPILSCSELLNEELEEIAQDDDLLDRMAEKIPDCVIDLYLLLNAPEE